MKRVLERTSCRKEIDVIIISKVPIDTVTNHLKSRGSALSLPFSPNDYQAFHVQMEQGDEERIVLWWENENATKDRDCRLVNSMNPQALFIGFTRLFMVMQMDWSPQICGPRQILNRLL